MSSGSVGPGGSDRHTSNWQVGHVRQSPQTPVDSSGTTSSPSITEDESIGEESDIKTSSSPSEVLPRSASPAMTAEEFDAAASSDDFSATSTSSETSSKDKQLGAKKGVRKQIKNQQDRITGNAVKIDDCRTKVQKKLFPKHAQAKKINGLVESHINRLEGQKRDDAFISENIRFERVVLSQINLELNVLDDEAAKHSKISEVREEISMVRSRKPPPTAEEKAEYSHHFESTKEKLQIVKQKIEFQTCTLEDVNELKAASLELTSCLERLSDDHSCLEEFEETLKLTEEIIATVEYAQVSLDAHSELSDLPQEVWEEFNGFDSQITEKLEQANVSAEKGEYKSYGSAAERFKANPNKHSEGKYKKLGTELKKELAYQKKIAENTSDDIGWVVREYAKVLGGKVATGQLDKNKAVALLTLLSQKGQVAKERANIPYNTCMKSLADLGEAKVIKTGQNQEQIAKIRLRAYSQEKALECSSWYPCGNYSETYLNSMDEAIEVAKKGQ